MFFRRPVFTFALQHFQGTYQTRPGRFRFDYIIDIPSLCCCIGIGETILYSLMTSCLCLWISAFQFPYDMIFAPPAPSRQFLLRPGKDQIGAQVFAAHCDICASICLAQNDINLWNCSFRVCVEKLGSMSDDAAMFLIDARKECRYVSQSNYGYIEAVAETDKARCLVRGINIQGTCLYFWLVGNDSYRFSIQTGKADNYILAKGIEFPKLTMVYNFSITSLTS